MFQQVPMVEIDGMKLVQTRAILNYIATKYNLYGKDIKERALYGIFSALSWMINVKTWFLPWVSRTVRKIMGSSAIGLSGID